MDTVSGLCACIGFGKDAIWQYLKLARNVINLPSSVMGHYGEVPHASSKI